MRAHRRLHFRLAHCVAIDAGSANSTVRPGMTSMPNQSGPTVKIMLPFGKNWITVMDRPALWLESFRLRAEIQTNVKLHISSETVLMSELRVSLDLFGDIGANKQRAKHFGTVVVVVVPKTTDYYGLRGVWKHRSAKTRQINNQIPVLKGAEMFSKLPDEKHHTQNHNGCPRRQFFRSNAAQTMNKCISTIAEACEIKQRCVERNQPQYDRNLPRVFKAFTLATRTRKLDIPRNEFSRGLFWFHEFSVGEIGSRA